MHMLLLAATTRCLLTIALGCCSVACGGQVDMTMADGSDQLETKGAAADTRCSISPGDLNGPESCASGICDVDIGCGGADPLPCHAIGDVCSRPGDPDGVMRCVASPAGYGRCR